MKDSRKKTKSIYVLLFFSLVVVFTIIDKKEDDVLFFKLLLNSIIFGTICFMEYLLINRSLISLKDNPDFINRFLSYYSIIMGYLCGIAASIAFFSTISNMDSKAFDVFVGWLITFMILGVLLFLFLIILLLVGLIVTLFKKFKN